MIHIRYTPLINIISREFFSKTYQKKKGEYDFRLSIKDWATKLIKIPIWREKYENEDHLKKYCWNCIKVVNIGYFIKVEEVLNKVCGCLEQLDLSSIDSNDPIASRIWISRKEWIRWQTSKQ
ncbi:hypothetical protein F8M41_003922 [Gigaspora margarita]|uniref:Uncharacterized protein n=1 Tax=Gigaspora margarita TaxID=4874 RepID=A0A8H3XDH4_GIGMA|nr:hypothetical protein F8M41_003922 [Gigaspora margarita]